MSMVNIELKERDVVGKEGSKKLRARGYVPAVFYGPNYGEGLPVQVAEKGIEPYANSAHWETVIFEVLLPNGGREMAIMREIQRNPVTDQILHIDFYQLIKGHMVAVEVPVELIGRERCEGVKKGGMLEQYIHALEIEVLPAHMPDVLRVDVSSLDLGGAIHTSDVPLPEGAALLSDPQALVAAVYVPAAVEEAVTEEVAVQTEPETIKVKGIKEEEE